MYTSIVRLVPASKKTTKPRKTKAPVTTARERAAELAAAEALLRREKDTRIDMRVAAWRKLAYEEAAEAAGMTLTAWLVEASDRKLRERPVHFRRPRGVPACDGHRRGDIDTSDEFEVTCFACRSLMASLPLRN